MCENCSQPGKRLCLPAQRDTLHSLHWALWEFHIKSPACCRSTATRPLGWVGPSVFYGRYLLQLTLNDQPYVVAGSAGEVFGGTRVQARVTALGGGDGQSSIGQGACVSAGYHGPPLLVPSHLRLGLPVGLALQADRPAQHHRVLHPGDIQHWGH